MAMSPPFLSRGSRGNRVGRRVGAMLTTSLVVLSLAAMLLTWRQPAMVGRTAALASDSEGFRQAHFLVGREQLLLRAAVTGLDAEWYAAQLRALRPMVLDSLARLAESAGGERRRDLVDLLDAERLLQASTEALFAILDRADLTAAAALVEGRGPLMESIAGRLSVAQRLHTAEYQAQLAMAARQARLLRYGMVLVFLVGLAVLAVTGWLRRTDRRAIERMAAEDALTGLPNRTAFQARAEVAIGAAGDGPRRPIVLVVDLDGFKEVNDSLGHYIGDKLLVEVGARLRACVRGDADTVARIGGDEFAVLLVDAEARIGEETADRLCQALVSPFVIDGMPLDVEASIGIATAAPGQDVGTLVRQATAAMYVSKEHHLAHSRYDPNQAGIAARLTLVGSIRRALDDDELVLHYQPKVAVGTGELIGAEALARWQHPTRGLLGPAEFIPVLERTSLVHRFTQHVLTMALAQARAWLDGGHRIPVAVNVSTRCLLDQHFPEVVAGCLLAAGVPGELLWIEITENTVMADPERAIDGLRRIRALGVSTAIDDFGTGYSSMAYLRILPMDEIKIDRSFVKGLGTDERNRVLVKSTVELGHNLGLTVIAEGVEDGAALQALRDLGCDGAQGYFLCRPLSIDDFDAWLSNRAVPV